MYLRALYLLLLILVCGLISHAQPVDTAQAHLDFFTGENLMMDGEYDSAFQYYNHAAEAFQKAGIQDRYAASLGQIGLVYFMKRDKKTAIQYFDQAYDILIELLPEDDLKIALLYNYTGGAHLDLGYYAEGKKYLEKALAIREKKLPPNHEDIGPTYYNLGLANIYQSENQEAVRYFLLAMPIYLNTYGKTGNRMAQLYNNIGLCYSRLGDKDHAMDYYTKSIEIHLENHGPDYWNLAYPYIHIGRLYQGYSNYELAEEYYKKALKISQRYDRLRDLQSKSYFLLGELHFQNKDFDKAEKNYLRSIEITSKFHSQDHPDFYSYYQGLGNIQRKRKRYSEALHYYEKAQKIALNSYGPYHPNVSGNYVQIGFLYHEQEKYNQALEWYQRALMANDEGFKSDNIAENPQLTTALSQRQMLNVLKEKAKTLQARFHQDENNEKDLEWALDCYLQMSDLLDHMRRGYLSEKSKFLLQERAAKTFESSIALCLELAKRTQLPKYKELAFFFMEKSKASLLAETLQAGRNSQFNGIPTNLIDLEKTLQEKISDRDRQLSNENQKRELGDSTKIAELEQVLFKLKVSQDSLAGILAKDFPQYYSLKYDVEVAEAKKVMESLNPNEAVLSYFLGDSAWYVAALSQNQLEVMKIPIDSLKGMDSLENFRKNFIDGRNDYLQQAEQAYTLYQNLVARPLQKLDGIDRLLVVPDGVLGHIPFDLFLTKDPSNYSEGDRLPYLIHHFTVSYASSMTVYFQNLKTNAASSSGQYIGFAPEYPEAAFADASNPRTALYRDQLSTLSGTIQEVQSAQSLWGGSAFLNQEATENAFKSLKSPASILHLAMHAWADDRDPMNSKLIFTQGVDSLEDGFLNAYEIYGLELNSQLAVLSACNTGFGEFRRGEGIMSLSRAFMYAGCPSIVMSLWRAQDRPTQQIMEHFFIHLKEGLPRNEALRQAKLDYLQSADPLSAHPANWATFVLIGQTNPIDNGFYFSWIWILAMMLLILVAGGGIYWMGKG